MVVYGGFPRTRADFPFSTVGRTTLSARGKRPFLRKTDETIATFLMGGQGRPPLPRRRKTPASSEKSLRLPFHSRTGPMGNRPYERPMKINEFPEGGQGRPPRKGHKKRTRPAKIAAFCSQCGGPMWASAPTNNHEKSTNFEGGQGRPPLQTGYDRPFVSSKSAHQISAVPAIFRRKKSSDFASNVGRIREIYILRRSRCPHRPRKTAVLMAVFRRIRVDFHFPS